MVRCQIYLPSPTVRHGINRSVSFFSFFGPTFRCRARLYPGVMRTAEDLECYVVMGSFMLFIPTLILFDFPLSLLADTLTLPVDLLAETQAPRAGAIWMGHC